MEGLQVVLWVEDVLVLDNVFQGIDLQRVQAPSVLKKVLLWGIHPLEQSHLRF